LKASTGTSGGEKWIEATERAANRAGKKRDAGIEAAKSKQTVAVIQTSRRPPDFDHEKRFLIFGAAA
jgi:hypothetical protein